MNIPIEDVRHLVFRWEGNELLDKRLQEVSKEDLKLL